MFRNRIFKIGSSEEFEQLALEIFQHQAKNNIVYKQFLDILKFDTASVKKTIDIPFLPIYFFKRFEIITGKNKPQEIFLSSGTTGIIQSKHFVTDVAVYKESYITAFEHFYGSIKDYTILALLPSYLEREGSSLIYMVDDFIKKTQNSDSGFYLNDLDKLAEKLHELNSKGIKVLLMGVTYALLDLIENQQFNLQNTMVMETGGMKGKRREMIREELHEKLCKGFGVTEIHSEYGMTELLSQAYSKGNGIFETPPWMKILIRDTEDAFSYLPPQKSGGINIIDLADYNSCSFIATQDLGKTHPNNTFEVLGRFDHSDIRGCNLLIG
ncbi:MAG: acyl transferase [Flavobacteriaceae bacterium]|nr:acyl transferase [Flavobacteriaceae bacterium]